MFVFCKLKSTKKLFEDFNSLQIWYDIIAHLVNETFCSWVKLFQCVRVPPVDKITCYSGKKKEREQSERMTIAAVILYFSPLSSKHYHLHLVADHHRRSLKREKIELFVNKSSFVSTHSAKFKCLPWVISCPSAQPTVP